MFIHFFSIFNIRQTLTRVWHQKILHQSFDKYFWRNFPPHQFWKIVATTSQNILRRRNNIMKLFISQQFEAIFLFTGTVRANLWQIWGSFVASKISKFEAKSRFSYHGYRMDKLWRIYIKFEPYFVVTFLLVNFFWISKHLRWKEYVYCNKSGDVLTRNNGKTDLKSIS